MNPPAGNPSAPSDTTIEDSLTMVPGVGQAELMAWLLKLDSDLRSPVTARRIGVGQSTLTYMLSDTAGHRWVLRRPPMGNRLNSAHDVLRGAHPFGPRAHRCPGTANTRCRRGRRSRG